MYSFDLPKSTHWEDGLIIQIISKNVFHINYIAHADVVFLRLKALAFALPLQ